MKDHSDCERGFHHTSEAWYGGSILRDKETEDEVIVGFYHPEGGTTGEFCFKWQEVGGKIVPKLEAFDDCWHALYQFQDLLTMMADIDNENITPHAFCERLRALGLKDKTMRKEKHEDQGLTVEQKRELYRKGQYLFPPPPVAPVQWDTDGWIKFIDKYGQWKPEGIKENGN